MLARENAIIIQLDHAARRADEQPRRHRIDIKPARPAAGRHTAFQHLERLSREEDRRLEGIAAARRLVSRRLDYETNMMRIEEFLARTAGK